MANGGWRLICIALALVMSVAGFHSAALAQAEYRLNPGDTLDISVWNEDSMHREVVVLPDGAISYPLAGHVNAAGLTPKQLEATLAKKLERFFPSPTITVAITNTSGNVIYVIGEVKASGQFPVAQTVDVIKALSLARGLTEFADTNSIKVVRRLPNGEQQAIKFNYAAVQRGRDLSSNIVLKSGDVVIVPAKGLF